MTSTIAELQEERLLELDDEEDVEDRDREHRRPA